MGLFTPENCLKLCLTGLSALLMTTSVHAQNSFDKAKLDALILEPEYCDALYGKSDRVYLHGLWKFQQELNTMELKGNNIVEKTPEQIKALSDKGIQNGYFKREFDDSKWSEYPVPLPWNVDLNSTEKFKKIPFAGVGYYRKHITIPADKKGKRVILHFNSVQTESKVWVNGQLAGEHVNAYSEAGPTWAQNNKMRLDDFSFDITDFLRFGEDNVIALRVFDDGQKIVYGAVDDGGIVGAVRLDFVENVYIDEIMLNADLSGKVDIKAQFNNCTGKDTELKLKAELSAFESANYKNPAKISPENIELGKKFIPAGKSMQEFSFTVKAPALWTPDSPALYLLQIKADGKQRGLARFGFRKMEIKGKDFVLNGHPISIIGTNPGARWVWNQRVLADNKADWLRTSLKIYKDWNLNLIRTNNGPNSDIFYDICDEIGLLTEDDYSPDHTDIAPGEGRAEMIRNVHVDKYVKEDGSINPDGKRLFRKWLVKVHNHPSVSLLTAGNEIGYIAGGAEFEKKLAAYINSFYDFVKANDMQQRPVTSSSGLAVWSWSSPVKSDFYDYHDYANGNLGWADCGAQNWTRGQSFNRIYGKIDKPLINGECGGYDIMHAYRKDIEELFKNGKLDKNAYVKWVNKLAVNISPITYHDYIGRSYYVAFKGIRSASGKAALELSTADLNSSYAEVMRRDMRFLQGFVLHDLDPAYLGLKASLYLTKKDVAASDVECRKKPEFTELRNALTHLAVIPDMYDRNIFAGEDFTTSFSVLNNQYGKTEADLQVTASILSKDGSVKASEIVDISDLGENSRQDKNVTLKVPSDIEGHCQLVFKLSRNGKTVHENINPLFIMKRDMLKGKISTAYKIALYNPWGETAESASKVLKAFGIPHNVISDSKDLASYDFLIIDAGTIAEMPQNDANAIRSWVEGGKRLLSLEQTQGGPVPFAEELALQGSGPMLFADMLDSEHPLFKGFITTNMEFWNGKRIFNGNYYDAAPKAVYDKFIVPMPEGVVLSGAARSAAWQKNPRFGMVAGELKIGKGLAFFSQTMAVKRFGSDSSASLYLKNLLEYVLSDKWTGERASVLSGRKALMVDRSKCFFVDISKKANRSFKDDVNADQKGGWTDQGENDFRMLPSGEQNLNGVPYRILPGKTDTALSCMVIAGKERPYFPKEITGIPVNKKAKRLFFLHATAWGEKGEKAAEYRINYADGKTEVIDLIQGKNIGGWWSPNDISEAGVACTYTQASGNSIGLYNLAWKNPNPSSEIKSIDFISTGKGAVPACVAISGELAP